MKRLLLISILIPVLFACDKNANLSYPEIIMAGQTLGTGINYSGILNDTLYFEYPSSSTSRLVDINKDDVADFELIFSGSASPGHASSQNSIVALANSAVAVDDIANLLADTIPRNVTIGKRYNWVNDTCIIYNQYWDASGSSSKKGLWNNVRNKYIGTRIIIDDKVMYGWIRLELTDGWNLTLVDYAGTYGY